MYQTDRGVNHAKAQVRHGSSWSQQQMRDGFWYRTGVQPFRMNVHLACDSNYNVMSEILKNTAVRSGFHLLYPPTPRPEKHPLILQCCHEMCALSWLFKTDDQLPSHIRITGWWFNNYFLIFTPILGEDEPILTVAYFCKWGWLKPPTFMFISSWQKGID